MLGLDPDGKFRLMKSWIPIDKPLHSIDPNTCPRRLLDLTLAGAIQRSGPFTTAGFAALSHRWGTHQHLTLKRSTMRRLKRSFPVSELPQTFQDAVYVTRRLGFSYLWIDALCIMQDSEDDWLQE
ncbi:hypothetical protein BDV96DRAFT_260210 [Lophiotrema nucula]|uniref:Heterokaryon incompatibility domain-containing protein n=1 Tax=Lophiotrema nucula TaxID=690887 RepID=A0A6A5YNG4_9PLEO|nr:hypothetical protein BDV96DRAFT_260210 [Lophiotrema nucula]